ncbi:hypothetical protein BV898_19803 [Hypsibius exemplaris]|uniref:Uncharacterized protein n=1 Tax=Hypsibius exemplaris TaxID=2072580 RepID=A0A9X6NM88_HYPEX|nr:hypothetical protein BV898_19803 [Hypsibius exemplaris]
MRVPPGNISGEMTIQQDGLHHHAYAVIADPVNISLDVTAAEAYPNPLNAHPTLQYFFVTCLALQSVFGTIGNILVSPLRVGISLSDKFQLLSGLNDDSYFEND